MHPITVSTSQIAHKIKMAISVIEDRDMNKGIVYIEDNAFNMRLMRRILSVTPYPLYEAFDGASGLQMIQMFKPNLVLIDINLPDIDGLKIVKILKADPTTAHMHCVALTANAMHGDRERCIDAGFDDYMAKPIVRRELIELVNTYMAPEKNVSGTRPLPPLNQINVTSSAVAS